MLARVIKEETVNNPKINSKKIAAIVEAKVSYRRKELYTHYRKIRHEFLRHMNTSQSVNMVALTGYSQILRGADHTVKIIVLDATKVKEQRIIASNHISYQCKKS